MEEEKKYSKELIKKILANHVSTEYLENMFKQMDELSKFNFSRPDLTPKKLDWFLEQSWRTLIYIQEKEPLSFWKDLNYDVCRTGFYIAISLIETYLSEGFIDSEEVPEWESLAEKYKNLKV